MYVWKYTHMYVCMYDCKYITDPETLWESGGPKRFMHSPRKSLCMYVCVEVYTYVCMYVCVEVYTYVCMYDCMYVTDPETLWEKQGSKTLHALTT